MSIIKPWSNFNRSACPKSLRWRNNYRALRRRPGLRELSAEDFWVQEKKDFERLPKCRKYLAERRRRPAPAAMRAHMATLGALPDGGVASAEVAAEVNAEAVQVSRNAPPGALAERVLYLARGPRRSPSARGSWRCLPSTSTWLTELMLQSLTGERPRHVRRRRRSTRP